MKRLRSLLLWLFVLGGCAAGGYYLFAGQAHAPQKKETKDRTIDPVPITVARITARDLQRSVQVVGTFQGFEEVSISPKVEGRVARVYREVGDRVKPGDRLLDLDDADLKLAHAEARRSLELELTRLRLRALPEGTPNLDTLPSVEQARHLEEKARRMYERIRRSGRGVSPDDLEKAESDARVATTAREQAHLEVRATLATARLRQAQVRTVKQKLDDTHVTVPPQSLRAPPVTSQSGVRLPPLPTVEYVVVQRLVTEGEMVRAFPSTTVFKLVIDRTLKLIAPVPERHLADVEPGQSVRVQVEAYPGEVFRGCVARVMPSVDRINRTFQIEVWVPNDDGRLRVGSFTRAEILTRHDNGVLTVPEESLVTFAGVTKVFVVRGDKAFAIPVRPGQAIEISDKGHPRRWIEARGTLSANQPVVTSGTSQLADATPVRIKKRD